MKEFGFFHAGMYRGNRDTQPTIWPICHLLYKCEVYVLVPGQISVSDYCTNDKAYNMYSFLPWGAARALELAGTVAVDSEPRESAQVMRDVRPISSRVRV